MKSSVINVVLLLSLAEVRTGHLFLSGPLPSSFPGYPCLICGSPSLKAWALPIPSPHWNLSELVRTQIGSFPSPFQHPSFPSALREMSLQLWSAYLPPTPFAFHTLVAGIWKELISSCLPSPKGLCPRCFLRLALCSAVPSPSALLLPSHPSGLV